MSDRWTHIANEINCVLADNSDEPISSTTAANVWDLLSQIRSGHQPPTQVGRGYWPTVRLCWNDVDPRDFEIEVFQSKYEFYRFFEDRTEIAEMCHSPGDAFSGELAERLMVIRSVDER
jgi:hypothetical protein